MAKQMEKAGGVAEFLRDTAKHESVVKEARQKEASIGGGGFVPANVRGTARLSKIEFGSDQYGPFAVIWGVCVESEPEGHETKLMSQRYFFRSKDKTPNQKSWDRFYADLQRMGADSQQLSDLSREQLIKEFCPEFVKVGPAFLFNTSEDDYNGKKRVKLWINEPASIAEDDEEEVEDETEEEEVTEDEESEEEEEEVEGEEEYEESEEEEEEEEESFPPKVGDTVVYLNKQRKVMKVNKSRKTCRLQDIKTKKMLPSDIDWDKLGN